MALTIVKTLLQENLTGDNANQDLLREIISKHTVSPRSRARTLNAQAVFDEIASLDGWTTPSPDNDASGISWWDEVWPVTLRDGTRAGLLISKSDDKLLVNIIQIPES